ncbi:hypothetical protein DRA42_09025 [Ethanoligenens harbinense]|nr:hypothetical protein CXQ68_08995 [Ethanoligenens harbinense YUAN-3]AYF39002.1 hypothetical protein CXP51_08865 [Ethanoligenens harbinense]AYF41755.1 hypothetical protein CN246_09015 [Ethanoligenens harbinense]QCN92585.1 hypothetical protein DRA42_09025 [Ethanoligenens harbinense]
MSNLNSGDWVKTTEYFNTQPFSNERIEKGRVIDVLEEDGWETATVSYGRGQITKISTKYLIKIK